MVDPRLEFAILTDRKRQIKRYILDAIYSDNDPQEAIVRVSRVLDAITSRESEIFHQIQQGVFDSIFHPE